VLVMRRGRIAANGAPGAVMQDALLSDVFDCPLKVGALPSGATPFVLPQAALA
jgi:iron complex transport system ATP-binding protein